MGTDNVILSAVLAPYARDSKKDTVVAPSIVVSPVNFVRYQGKDGAANPHVSCEVWAAYTCDVLLSFLRAYRPKAVMLVTWHDTVDFIAAVRRVCYLASIETGFKVDALRVWTLARAYAVEKGLVGKEERHAAKIETSLMQHIAPDQVKTGKRRNVPWTAKEHFAIDWESFSDQGTYGNAANSSAELGANLLSHLIPKAAEIIEAYFRRKSRKGSVP